MAKLASKIYGDALFELAVEEGRVDSLWEEVRAVRKAMSENRGLTALMEHPNVVKEEKLKLLEDIFRGRVSDDMTGFLLVVETKGRYGELPGIFDYFENKVKEYKNIGVVYITSPARLSGEWKKKIEAKILVTTKYETLEAHYRVDESLMGGLIIRLGDRVVDSSVKHKLEQLTLGLEKISLETKKEGAFVQ
ncbi:ATP synthase F1 subunit delta [Murimonas intestini]|uniref:ATP synthase F1 subunit delta n=1 Tax=Murimonas intestini TaxID=1337051 RepID=UPI0011DDF606|nr:ATP synthase F1 subunit delta [Murimonas intestini]